MKDQQLSGTCEWPDDGQEKYRHPIQGLSDAVSSLLLLAFAAYCMWLVFGGLFLAIVGD